MQNDKDWQIPELKISEEEITSIVQKGNIRKESFITLIKGMYRRIGFRFLMKDWLEMLLAAGMLAMLMIGITATASEGEAAGGGTSFYSLIMIVSPLLYAFLAFLPYLKSRASGTYELEMVCKYNLHQLAAFRMLIFSVFCFLLNSIWVLALAVRFAAVEFVQGLLISTASLLIFSVLFLYVLSFFKTNMARAAALVIWIAGNIILVILNNSIYMGLLISVPWYLYGAVIVLFFYLYMKKLKELLIHNKRRGGYTLC
ncbi:hypothetical protein [Bacillus infantis]|uniref:hypothetical protein n=1 Tax=Bacillus infantis TaxID=324767 RepID=UPI003CF405BC